MIPVESQADFPFTLTNSDRKAGQPIEPVMLYLTVIVSPNTSSHLVLPISTPRSTEVVDFPTGEATRPSMTQVSTNTIRSAVATGSVTCSPPTSRLPNDINTPMPPVADRRAGASPAKNALLDADEAMTTINVSSTLEGALERIKWVMDTVSLVAEVRAMSFLLILHKIEVRPQLHPYAKMAYGLLFAIPKTLVEQFQRDDNIRTLLGAMHDAFDFTNREDRFKTIERVPRQAQILTLMLQHVCNCCDFIQSYAKNSQLWKRILKNTGSQVDKKIEDFRSTLLELHKASILG
ncbi:hypothetical protein EDB92DRAFT_497310 [Lactarius akahatsu]|uniref:Uncharacterized protein n=1 Tax=Lactarius akahatsu TaxID=416441 RepID=A0AAD4LPR0_9AGAM|nr:hypothetical protein EDB92DRAFT_497310 [Lactarius akahatsu]